MAKQLQGKVVVITGASSGIGRVAASLFAREGAIVVLAARSAKSLEEVRGAVTRAGAEALVVPTDMLDETAARNLARSAIERFGRIDIWVNDAAVALFARAGEAPSDVYRRVIENNVFSVVNGSLSVLPYFHKQGHGVLINVGSILSVVGVPFMSAYVTSKFAIRGFSDCLRQEVRNAPRIHVCTVLPATVDTPLYQHAGNYTGRALQPVPPIYSAEKVARAIVRAARRPRREVPVGAASRAVILGHRLVPRLTARVMAVALERRGFTNQPAQPTPGNIFTPMPEWNRPSGGWRRSELRRLWQKLFGSGNALSRAAAAILRLRP